MAVAVVMALANQKRLVMAISVAPAEGVDEIETSRVDADSMIMAPFVARDGLENAKADTSESARRSRHC